MNKIKQYIVNSWNSMSKGMQNTLLIVLLCSAFLSGLFYTVLYEYYFYLLIPVILFVVVLLFLNIKIAPFLIAFITPLSVTYTIKDLAISLPSEPLLIFVMLLFVWEVFFTNRYDKKVLKNPVSIAIYISLVWTFITSIFSVDYLVSFKYLLSQFWFIIPCYFVVIPLFKRLKNLKNFFLCYVIPLSVIAIVCIGLLSTENFALSYAHYVMQPFYNDHTAYGAVLALFVPLSFVFVIGNEKLTPNIYWRIFAIIVFVVLVLGLIFSYSRAAWASVLASVAVFVAVKMRIKLKTILIGLGVVGVFVLIFWSSILGMLQQNNQDSSGNMVEHMTSITNISTDDSNVERLNRWACALSMFEERPIVGWGPGTYKFIYSGYQKSYNLTQISTNAGILGSTHSEYLKPLSEQGFFGTIAVLILYLTTVCIGLRVYHKAEDKAVADLALFLVLSLVTYYVHGVFNNFLETEKLAVPFWGLTAMIVALDIYYPKKNKENKLIDNKNKN
ncbi:MAG: O-antigen ligase family protein [Bacteroidales bacterium]|nr:O-antigen ligase family protein [Bacteroidales bacterium]